ncbi:CAMK protein kinase [Blastocystis sp. subtype 4]|uniref:CAMK protein kinase n=1 Tax=Blastocystis sp. subtype 4 TaxID=944170 RepID=UPI0007118A30|nr:CAMK protein kinase [Blastocystis sp. subtype 4]KNB45543.1 CAMK protein kinase [Blastocystis sp. subtype 4]|eukprot:XP_014528985.1 CAMK protein kinase [Blastocystis sp. subtype 4]
MQSLKVKRDGKVIEYTLLEKLGKGSYSQVFKCMRTSGNEKCIFAVKVFNKSFLKNEKTWKRVSGGIECHSAFEKVELEIALMKRLSHPNLVKLIDVIDDEVADRLYMVLEYIEKGQVMICNQATMQFYSPITGCVLDENTARHYMIDIISGLKYLHLHKVVHRDIKPENLLVTNDNHVKISF